jgi:hypothetical protein
MPENQDAPEADDITQEQLVDAVEERLRMLEQRVREEIASARSDLSSLVKRITVKAMAVSEDASRNRSLWQLIKSDDISASYVEVLRASEIHSNRQLAKELKIHESLISMYARGERPIPRERALLVQELTRSKKFKNGIEPTKKFWPGGVV